MSLLHDTTENTIVNYDSSLFNIFLHGHSSKLDDTLEMPFVLTAVRSALHEAKPIIWNSDQGSHFTSEQYTHLLKEAGVRVSMDGKNRALDHIKH